MKRHLFAALLIMAVSICLYANTLQNTFVYDDAVTITGNTMIKDIKNLPKLVVKKEYFSRSGEMTYRPVVTFTYFFDYALYRLKPWGYHLTNILLHTVNGILLYIFLTIISQISANSHRPVSIAAVNPALLITLLFVTHPILTEAVNAVSFREDLLVFMFYITALIFYIRTFSTISRIKSTVIYMFSCFSYVLALLSKEMAVTLPIIIYLYEWFYRSKKNALTSVPSNRHAIGYIALTLAYFWFRFYYFYNPIEENIPAWSLKERVLTVPWLFLNYIKVVIFPVSLSVIHKISSVDLSVFLLSFSIAVFVVVITFLVKEKNFIFGILFFGITLLPVYNIIPIVNPFAERYLYLPVAGFVTAIYYLISERLLSRHRVLSYGILTALLLIIGLNSWHVLTRNRVWLDSNSLWADTIRKAPDDSRVYNEIGAAYIDQNKFDEAVEEFKAALKLHPDNPMSRHNLGFVYYKQGRFEEAIQEFKAALRLRPNYSLAHNNLGNVYFSQGRLEEALREYEKAVEIDTDNPSSYTNMGNVYSNTGNFDKAVSYYRMALELDPDFTDAHYGLGRLYLIMGLKEEARKELEITLKLNPAHSEALRMINR